MPGPDFSPAIVTFVRTHVRSVEELQLLMALAHTPDRWWDARSAAREVGMPGRDARSAFDFFAAHNLLDIRITDDVRYQFRPGTDALREAARDTAAAYRSRPIDVARLVSGTRARAARDFADAFRIRRHDDR
jgi:hypothetical protein